MARARSSTAAVELAEGVQRGYLGIHPDDAELCLDVDVFSFAMVTTGEGAHMVSRPVAVAGVDIHE